MITIVAGISFHALFSVYLSSLFPAYGDLIRSWKEILILCSAALLVGLYLLQRKKLAGHTKTILGIAITFILLHILIVLINPQTISQTIAGLFIDLRFVAFFIISLVFITLYPQYRTILLRVYAVAALTVVIFGFLQATVLPNDFLKYFGYGDSTIQPYLTVDQNPDYIRINSTLRGPNPLGVYAASFLIVLLAYVTTKYRVLSYRAKVFTWVGILLSSVSLWFSYSRSALAMGLFGVMLLGGLALWRKIGKGYFMTIAASLVLVGVLFGYIAKDTHFVQHVVFHNNPRDNNPINSDHGHEASLKEGSVRVLEEPFGAGVGTTGSASLRGDEPLIIESQYLFIAHEAGIIGLVLFLLLYGLVLYRLWQNKGDSLSLGLLVSGIGILLVGVIQPVFVDDTVSIVWWGLAGLALASRPKQRGGKK